MSIESKLKEMGIELCPEIGHLEDGLEEVYPNGATKEDVLSYLRNPKNIEDLTDKDKQEIFTNLMPVPTGPSMYHDTETDDMFKIFTVKVT